MCGLLAACSTQPASETAKIEPQPPVTSASSQATARPAPAPAMTGSAMVDAKVTKRSVYYDFDKAEIKAEQLGTVEANARYLGAHPELKVRIEGNTDERGSREYNLALGQRRAESVMKVMTLLGIPGPRMESVSYGEEKPRATGHDEQSWAENRRSDIVYP
jgi:peptidoglycan-associated lipoprotein